MSALRMQIKFQGLTELEHVMQRGGDRDIRQAMVKQLRTAARVVRNQARINAPVGTQTRPPAAGRQGGKESRFRDRTPGRLRRSIREKVRVKTRTDAFATIGPRGQDVFYDRFVEFGTEKMAARPFMASALASTESQVVEIMSKPIDEFDRRVQTGR